MTVKLVVVSAVTALALLAVGVVTFFFLMLGMNGVHERKAEVVFAGFFVLTFLTLLVAAVASGWGAGRLAHATSWPMWAAGPLAVLVVSVAGGALIFFGSIVILAVVVN